MVQLPMLARINGSLLFAADESPPVVATADHRRAVSRRVNFRSARYLGPIHCVGIIENGVMDAAGDLLHECGPIQRIVPGRDRNQGSRMSGRFKLEGLARV